MKKMLIASLLLLSSHTAYAIMSPLNQSVVEIRTIIESPEVGSKIPQGQAITQIQRVESGYLLQTAELQMQIDLEYVRVDRPGAQKFNLKFHDPVSR